MTKKTRTPASVLVSLAADAVNAAHMPILNLEIVADIILKAYKLGLDDGLNIAEDAFENAKRENCKHRWTERLNGQKRCTVCGVVK